MENIRTFYGVRFGASIVLVLSLCSCIFATPEEFRSDVQGRVKDHLAKINTIGDKQVSYITSDELEGDISFYKEQSYTARRDNIGAIRLVDLNTDDNKGRVYTLYRNDDSVMAETKISQGSNRKYFFMFGFDKNEYAPAIGFRLEF